MIKMVQVVEILPYWKQGSNTNVVDVLWPELLRNFHVKNHDGSLAFSNLASDWLVSQNPDLKILGN